MDEHSSEHNPDVFQIIPLVYTSCRAPSGYKFIPPCRSVCDRISCTKSICLQSCQVYLQNYAAPGLVSSIS
ncbi:hypothetical protein RRG08_056008 [Elysia crispata]|uniref:Uncharacterized protein n=1 Tax=Elysia crispata TaxID=231223 RepID=A0AAE1AIC2_9GAST|nr:hypothetical protein RRG08_056008 [Elysia crispata]